MIQPSDWPEPPEIKAHELKEVVELKKSLYQAKLDLYKAQQEANIEIKKARVLADIQDESASKLAASESVKAAYANEYAFAQAVHNAYLEVAKQQVDAPGNKADFVQKAATAISVAYVAVIGLSYGLGEKNTVLPVSGILPTIFLGISIFLATAYTAYVTDPGTTSEQVTEGTLPGNQRIRRNTFIRWAQSAALGRRRLIHTAVISLGVAICYLPAPYLQINIPGVLILALAGILCCILIPLIIVDHSSNEQAKDKSESEEKKNLGA